MGKCCSSLASHLGVGESNSDASSILQALHLLGQLPASAGPHRWLHSPATLINNCLPAWRAGLQRDRRVISLQAAAVPACGAKGAPLEVGDPSPYSMSGTAMAACMTHSLLLPLLLKKRVREEGGEAGKKDRRLQLSIRNPGGNYGLNFK